MRMSRTHAPNATKRARCAGGHFLEVARCMLQMYTQHHIWQHHHQQQHMCNVCLCVCVQRRLLAFIHVIYRNTVRERDSPVRHVIYNSNGARKRGDLICFIITCVLCMCVSEDAHRVR